ncbi:MAG: hypothetical protein M0D53_06295 [Flavobacterium sp. JAD_PAG50586_2]|nr:MAG: hypothetical protein M0D53_06295 [Flavobacterium sp. JAD_PAG50586_2]
MGFSDKAKAYFYNDLGLDNRGISKRMDNYSESLISRYLNQDKISATFILKIKKYFPEANVEDWMDDKNQMNEPTTDYEINPIRKINRMIKDLEELKMFIKDELSQK